ncbi:MAG TPA: Gfo/Idh/MocA family oxidoreductase [Flavisolibacter sp.]
MNDHVINWGIIGCGNVTEVKSGPAFQKVAASGLVAVMRRNGAKAKDYAERHGVPKWYSNADELINDPDVNAIYVATPPLSHEEYAIRALVAGKPVYVEKPMTINALAAERILQASQEAGVKLCVAHYRRQQPLFLKIKEWLDTDAIGDVQVVNLQFFQPHNSDVIASTEAAWRLDPALSGGGLFHDLAPHQLDLMLYFFGKPKTVSGLSLNTAGLYSADDTTSGQIVFESGVVFNGIWCFTLPAKRDHCEIIGTRGIIRFSVFDHQPVQLIKDGKDESFAFEKLPHVQQPMIAKVVEYFLGQSHNPCSAEEGLEVMKMIDAFTR